MYISCYCEARAKKKKKRVNSNIFCLFSSSVGLLISMNANEKRVNNTNHLYTLYVCIHTHAVLLYLT